VQVPNARLVRRHFLLGWIFVPTFMLLGLTLETLHGFKVQWYLSVANETRRFLWTLAHAHGVLLGVVNIVFALSLHVTATSGRLSETASKLLLFGSLLLPAGFLLGGVVIHGGDPGIFIVLSPVGGALVAVAMVLAAIALIRNLREHAA